MPTRYLIPMTYVLHYAPDNASLIVRLAMAHAGLPFRTVLVDRAAKAQETASFRALNPNGLIPVLETPQGPLFETGAILLWLTDRHRGLGPGPQDPARGEFLKWLFFVANTVHPCLRMLFYSEKYIGADPKVQQALRRGLQVQLKQSFATLETVAARRPDWLTPDRPGVLNFYIAACLRWPALYPLRADHSWFALADTPHLRDICAGVETLSCCAATIAAEGLGPTPFTKPDYPNPPEGSAT